MRALLRTGIASFALVAAAACASGDDSTTTADTTTMPGIDTISVPMAVPTIDTLVTERTITTDTNVIRGGARDTTRRP
ncbi:MAG: hypothetical protein H0X64_05920 [Gemmatimonadaceae bacterium]|nr:hypothetical protein [Gemmatimonadaceae bacterium]